MKNLFILIINFIFFLGPIEYKTHNDSLRDNCSYRNTDRVR
jgi:hypothetical protein